MTGLYIIRDGEPKPCEDVKAWGRWYEKANRHIGDDTINGVRVSTIFLGIDHAFGAGPPVLYETMAFGADGDEIQKRYHTEHEARQGHAAMIEAVRRQSQAN